MILQQKQGLITSFGCSAAHVANAGHCYQTRHCLTTSKVPTCQKVKRNICVNAYARTVKTLRRPVGEFQNQTITLRKFSNVQGTSFNLHLFVPCMTKIFSRRQGMNGKRWARKIFMKNTPSLKQSKKEQKEP